MRKPIFIGEKSYKYKKDVLLHYKTILNSYNFGQSLNDADFNDLLDLIFQHREDSIEKNLNNESIRTPSSYVLNPSHFAKEQVDTEPILQERYIKCPISNTQIIDYENASKLSNELNIAENERYYCILQGDFIFGDFIEAFIVNKNLYVLELTISTVSLNQENIESLFNLVNGGFIEKLNLIVHEQFFTYEKDNLITYLYQKLDINNILQLAVYNNKTKIILIEDEDQCKYVFHGSANLTSTNSLEQICLEENKLLYDYNKNILDRVIDQFKTINPTVTDLTEPIPYTPEYRAFINENAEREPDITDIKVSQVQYNTKCFEIFYSDQTRQFISYIMLINQQRYSREKLFSVACRSAIQDDLKYLKQAYFNKHAIKGQVKCQETGIPSLWKELCMDHRQPNTFSVLVDRFKELEKIDLEQIEYGSNSQNLIIFADQNISDRFKQYHKQKANLRIVRNECNLSRSGQARLKRSSKDLIIE